MSLDAWLQGKEAQKRKLEILIKSATLKLEKLNLEIADKEKAFARYSKKANQRARKNGKVSAPVDAAPKTETQSKAEKSGGGILGF